MKKIKLLFVAALALAASSALMSCSKSNEELINEYRDLSKEVVEATKANDMAKVQSLAEKGQKLGEELDKRELTPEEQAEVLSITSEMTKGVMEHTSDIMEDSSSFFE